MQLQDRLSLQLSQQTRMDQQNVPVKQLQQEDYQNRPPSRSQLKHQDRYWFIIFGFITTAIICISVGVGKYSQIGIWNRGLDPDGLVCGLTGEAKEYPYMYLTNPNSQYVTHRSCVKQCPGSEIDCLTNILVKNCSQQISIMNQDQQVIIYSSFTCTQYVLTPDQQSICIPTVSAYFEEVYSALIPSKSNAILNDIWQCRYILLITYIFVIAMNLVLLKFIQTYPNLATWTFILASTGFLGVAAIYFISGYVTLTDSQAIKTVVHTSRMDANYINQRANPHNPLIFIITGFIMLVSFTLSCLMIYRKFNQIQVMAEGVEISAHIMKNNNQIIKVESLVSAVLFSLTAIMYTTFMATLAKGDMQDPIHNLPLLTFQPSGQVLGVLLMLVSIFIYWFLNHLIQSIIAILVTIWYAQQLNEIKHKESKYFPVQEGVFRVLHYHLGTVLMGSILINLAYPINLICSNTTISALQSQLYAEMAQTNNSFEGCFKDLQKMKLANHQPIYNQVVEYASIFSTLGNLFVGGTSAYLGQTLYHLTSCSSLSYSSYSCMILCALLGYCCSSIFMQNYSMVVTSLIHLELKDQDYHTLMKTTTGRNIPRQKEPESLKLYLNSLRKLQAQDQEQNSN